MTDYGLKQISEVTHVFQKDFMSVNGVLEQSSVLSDFVSVVNAYVLL